MLILENINLTLSKNTKLENHVVKNMNMHIKKGEFVVVIGGNGAGKSTMLNIISGFLKTDCGKIIIDNIDVTLRPQDQRALYVSTVMQDPRMGTMENMTIFENMTFAYKRGLRRNLIPFTSKSRIKLFKEKLSMLDMGLEVRLEETVSNLSGGQRQALSLVMAIATGCKILLLDEITAALDPKIAETVMQLSDKIINEENLTCIMITHNMNHAIRYGSRLIALKDGSILKEYTATEKQQITPMMLAAEFEEF